MGRWGTADEIAEVACFLASRRASYVTGQTIRVEVSHYTSKAGKVSAVVKKYLQAADKPAAKKAAKKARVTTAVALASDDDDDDIPF